MSYFIKKLISKMKYISALKRLIKPRKLIDIFTPNTIARLTYIRREDLENSLSLNLSIPGKQIIIYGDSGSGKTTLLKKILSDNKTKAIQIHCSSDTTFDDIILDTFDSLNPYYTKEKNISFLQSISSALKSDYKILSTEIGINNKVSSEEKKERLLPPRLTPQKLAKFLGAIEVVLILEDFHKVSNEEKKKIADILKIFIDTANDFPKVKIVCIGAVGSANELIKLDSNLYPRIAELHVPLLLESEIKALVKRGCDILNISMSDNLVEKISYYSNRLASLTHQMCYDICCSNNILKTQCKQKRIDDRYFQDAINSYINRNSDTLKNIYDSCVKRSLAWYILKTFVTKMKDSIKFEEIRSGVCQNQRAYTDEEIRKELEELSAVTINIIRYDKNSDKYSISTPFWGAFLKIQIATEDLNRMKKNKRKNLVLKNQDDFDADVLNIMLKIIEGYKDSMSRTY